MDNPEHVYADINNIRFHYVTQGEGKLVIMLHGFPEYWYAWRKQIPALAKNLKVIAPDLRGYNETDKPIGIDNYAPDVLVNDVAALIQHAGYDKAHIIAHDWGGGIAWRLAQDRPDLVDRLVILNSPYPSIFGRHLRTNPRQMFRSWYIFLFQIPKIPEWLIRLMLRPTLKYLFRGWSINKQAFTDEEIDQYISVFKQKGTLTAAINYYRAAFKGRAAAGKDKVRKQVHSPTLVIWGKNDRALGVELTEGMDKYFTSTLEIKYLERCSHWVQHEYPELVNETINEFLQRR